MSRSVKSIVEPKILTWARTTAGLSIDEAANKIATKSENVAAWENEEDNSSPSMSQLRKMATVYKRLLSDFYMPAVPDEKPLPHDFRRLPGEVAYQYSRALRYQLRAASERRQLALDLASELDQPIPNISTLFRVNRDTERTGAELRKLLDISFNLQSTFRDPRTGYNNWRAAVERIGILVFQIVGIPATEMLGFSLVERPLPVIAVNRKLQPNGRTFTLVHELVHVFLGESSICDIEENVTRPPAEQKIEVFCNAVAAATLVPFDNLLADPIVANAPLGLRDWTNDELLALSRKFCVSQEVILRRLLTAGRASNDFYASRRALWGTLMQDVAALDPDAEIKRNMPREVISIFGKPFTRLVFSSYENSYTSLSDVSRYLGLRPEKVSKLHDLLVGG
jgi:Zn-dependent peptidase ImmA (M78 family)